MAFEDKVDKGGKGHNEKVAPDGPVKSLRCWGLRPSGPPAEPLGNDLIAEATASGVAATQSLALSIGGGIAVCGWGGGCLS